MTFDLGHTAKGLFTTKGLFRVAIFQVVPKIQNTVLVTTLTLTLTKQFWFCTILSTHDIHSKFHSNFPQGLIDHTQKHGWDGKY